MTCSCTLLKFTDGWKTSDYGHSNSLLWQLCNVTVMQFSDSNYVWRIRKPWPSNPCFFGKENEDPPQKSKDFSLSAEPLKTLEKRAKTHKKSKEKRKMKKARKTKKARTGGSGNVSNIFWMGGMFMCIFFLWGHSQAILGHLNGLVKQFIGPGRPLVHVPLQLLCSASIVWKATKEYLNHRVTVLSGPLSSRPLSLILPPSFPFRPCPFSYPFPPLHLLLYPPPPPRLTPGKLVVLRPVARAPFESVLDIFCAGQNPRNTAEAFGFGLRNCSSKRKSLATFHPTLKAQCNIALSRLGNE